MTSCAVAAPPFRAMTVQLNEAAETRTSPPPATETATSGPPTTAPATEVVSARPRSMATSAAAALSIRPSLPSLATTSPFESWPVRLAPAARGSARRGAATRPRRSLHGANPCAASDLRGLEPSQASHPESTTLTPHHGAIWRRESERPTGAFALGYIMSIIGVARDRPLTRLGRARTVPKAPNGSPSRAPPPRSTSRSSIRRARVPGT